MKNRFWNRCRFIFLATLIAPLGLLAFASPSLADGADIPVPFYVSKNGNNADGKSWATAWNEMDQIQWAQINPGRGDSLTIDGGVGSMTYKTPLRVQLPYFPYLFQVKVSTQAGHDGKAIIAGSGQSASGIEIVAGSINLSGNHTNGLAVCGWGLDGVHIPQGLHTNIEYMEMYRNKRSGLHISGGFNLITRKCIMHDNGMNILVDAPNPIMSGIDKCWIYGSSYAYNTDGVQMGDGNAPAFCQLSNCVIGPGLRNGFPYPGATQFGGQLSNCLLINATRTNISTVKGLMLNRVTSFMTPLNPQNQRHACLKIDGNQTNPGNADFVNNSIFYGGAVVVAPGVQFTTNNNTQFNTTGNTTFLSASQVDPMFVSNVGAYNNQVSIRRLINTNFALQAGSPAAGTGSDVTSVAQLLSLF